jgi:hypothetical protein
LLIYSVSTDTFNSFNSFIKNGNLFYPVLEKSIYFSILRFLGWQAQGLLGAAWASARGQGR